MKYFIISPGKSHSLELRDAIAEFETRLSKTTPIEWSFPGVGTKETEGEAIIKQLKPEDAVLLLDERGNSYDSPGFSRLIENFEQASKKRLVLIIGGAFGVSEQVSARADATVSLSAMVFPHMLVRLMLVEQLYRARSIQDGGKYHHG